MKTRKPPRAIRRLFPQVTQVVDSRVGMEVHVSAKDCSTARKGEPADCAMARAVRREQEVDGAVIGLKYSYVIAGKKAMRFATPVSVQREITSFDRHHDFAPGDYHLAQVSPSNRLGKDKRKRRGSNTNRHHEGIVHKHTVRVRELRSS